MINVANRLCIETESPGRTKKTPIDGVKYGRFAKTVSAGKEGDSTELERDFPGDATKPADCKCTNHVVCSKLATIRRCPLETSAS